MLKTIAHTRFIICHFERNSDKSQKPEMKEIIK